MKSWRIITTLLLCLILVGSIACNPLGSSEPESTQQSVEVVRGDLTVTVSGSGNLEASNEVKLAFGVGGKVDKIYVKEGDEVSQGDLLAMLDTDSLELALAQAQAGVTEAQVALSKAQVAITQAQVARIQAQVALQAAELELDRAENVYKWPELEIQQANVDKARLSVESAQNRLKEATTDEERADWARNVALAQANLIREGEKLNAMLSSADTEEVAIKKLQVEAAKQSLEAAKQSLELTQQSPELLKQSLKLAEQSLRQAQKQLNEATITAPFDGVVARVGVDEKDTVSMATTIIHLIDPSSMELNVQVDEIDITEVKLEQRAIIEVDALPALALEGKVSSISLLPTQAAGVVVYDVKIEFDVPQGIGLRVGMSATADIIIAERSNVLLVPDRAIARDSQGNTIVEVMVNGQLEERKVVIGISDGFQTEIIDGLRDGEVVVERQAKPKSSGLGLFGQ